MTALSDARAHLSKSREFLQAAEINRDLDLYNAATSDAVISGINSKDAVCLALIGRTRKAVEWAQRLLAGAEDAVSDR